MDEAPTSGSELMTSLYAVLVAIEDGRIEEGEVEWSTTEGEGTGQRDTTLRIIVRKNAWRPAVAES